ncbi:DUF3440 domain-containing protein [Pseudoalteromonas sp. DL-6]|uniref:phosphoadenosine phosphosulfate reductase n=1 Tax=Pseudoalteromonas sp. DL-6 TaxID=1390185 RepID=UPI00103A9D42|nr:DUF3440 domain-containing protein [Pseudoalteromonas sp. DL-6]QBJ63644.1 phosphoadenosine phosphosulfate reductase [Pseudoalteromonas sp. DL-6]
MKHYLGIDVYSAACERIDYIFSHFKHFYVSFSGGKDSGALLNLTIQKAEELNRLPVDVLIVDFEAQYQNTIDFITRMVKTGKINPYWICLPISLRNAASQFQPKWCCWDKDYNSKWVREIPIQPGVISDINYFPFFKIGMEFEEFVIEFAKWYQKQKESPVGILIGIRADESLNRYRTIKNKHKAKFLEIQWSTKLEDKVYSFYPIYDWKTKDVWIANGKKQWDYNRTYDLMQKAGVSLSQQRLCQPFGDDQRKGLWLYQILEPNTWQKLVERVEGCNFGARYSKTQGHILGYYRFDLPPGYTFRQYSKYLLNTMPPPLANHYRERIFKFLMWWRHNRKSFGIKKIPDYANVKLENSKKVPSWRRICKVLIKNDYWCRGLSFGQTKSLTEHYKTLYENYLRKE